MPTNLLALGRRVLERLLDGEDDKGEYTVPRGFHSSIDPPVSWWAIWDDGVLSYVLACSCGGIFDLAPENGRCIHSHDCGGLRFERELVLEGYPV